MTSQSTPQMPRFIAVTGREASGKDAYSEHLAELGYMHVAAGDVIRERARDEGYSDPISRETLSQVGDRFKEEFGPSPITTSSIERYGQQDVYPAGLVISGLRRVGEIKAFKDKGAVVLWIDASPEQRFANQGARARGDHRMTIEEFEELGDKEYYGSTGGGDGGVNLQAVEALADVRIENTASLEELFAGADQALTQFP